MTDSQWIRCPRCGGKTRVKILPTTITKEYDSQGDYELLKGDKYSAVDYTVMQGIEFDITEPHMAGGCVADKQMILKVIVKIRETFKPI